MEEIKNLSQNIQHDSERLQKQIEELNMLLARVSEIGKNCLSCVEWKHDKDICGKYFAKPPAKVIVVGCDYYDFIPF